VQNDSRQYVSIETDDNLSNLSEIDLTVDDQKEALKNDILATLDKLTSEKLQEVLTKAGLQHIKQGTNFFSKSCKLLNIIPRIFPTIPNDEEASLKLEKFLSGNLFGKEIDSLKFRVVYQLVSAPEFTFLKENRQEENKKAQELVNFFILQLQKFNRKKQENKHPKINSG